MVSVDVKTLGELNAEIDTAARGAEGIRERADIYYICPPDG